MSTDLNALLQRIWDEFPGFSFETVEFNNDGADHQVVILDGRRVFRFPRTPEYLASFPTEVAVLSAMRGRTDLALPRYDLMAMDGSFGGYPMVPGDALEPGRWAALPRPGREAILDSLAELLRTIHALPRETLRRADGTIYTNTGWADGMARRYFQEFRPKLTGRIPEAALRRLDALHEAYPEQPWTTEAVIHGDLWEAHILFLDKGRRLSGVIDFGDVVFGDPAHDFTVFWQFGDSDAERILGAYGADDAMALRSRWSYARYGARVLGGALTEPDEYRYDAEALLSDLLGHLDVLGVRA